MRRVPIRGRCFRAEAWWTIWRGRGRDGCGRRTCDIRVRGLKRSAIVAATMLWGLAWPGAGTCAQGPVLPGLPGQAQGKTAGPAEKAITAPTDDNPEATAAETAGPIAVDNTVSDDSVRRKLEKLLPKYPGVRRIEVEVEDGVVSLTGHVADGEVRDRLREFVRRVQGVNLVLNRTKTDAQVLTAQQYALEQVREYWDVIARKWLLVIIAIGLVLAAVSLARVFKRYSEIILAPFTGNVLLRSVLGSVIAVLIAVGGVLAGLHLVGMTEAVLSFLGLAGVVTLAVGFAFRDFAENFIASVMLGVRRPFRVGDFVEVAGKAGVVRSLNTRATILVTLDGSYVRIPNAMIFKEIVLNRTAASSVRGSFDVVIPWDASIATATEAITNALRTHEGFEDDPPPRTLVEAIEPGGIRLRAYFWCPAQGVDRLKLQSDAQLAAKVALQKAGLSPAPPRMIVQMAGDGMFGLPLEPRPTPRPAMAHAPRRQRPSRRTSKTTRKLPVSPRRSDPEDQENEIRHAPWTTPGRDSKRKEGICSADDSRK